MDVTTEYDLTTLHHMNLVWLNVIKKPLQHKTCLFVYACIDRDDAVGHQAKLQNDATNM